MSGPGSSLGIGLRKIFYGSGPKISGSGFELGLSPGPVIHWKCWVGLKRVGSSDIIRYEVQALEYNILERSAPPRQIYQVAPSLLRVPTVDLNILIQTR